jgi:hypothetical protein
MSWVDFAACRGARTDMFFPTDGRITPEVKAICDSCPVAFDCLVEAFKVTSDNDFGIRGGMTAKKRRVLRSRVTAVGVPAVQQIPPQTTTQAAMTPRPTMLQWNSTTQKYERI